MRIRLPVVPLVVLTLLFSICLTADSPVRPSDLPSAVFPSSRYTPHGYLDNPYHSMVFNRSGVLRSVPPMGFGFWRAEFKGNYGEGARDHQNYLSLLQVGVTIGTHSFASTEDFTRAGVELYSSYHTKNIFTYRWSYENIDVEISYFLPREHSLACRIVLTNSGQTEKTVTITGSHLYRIGDLKWWGSNGIASSYRGDDDAFVSKIWAYGDVFIFGGDRPSTSHRVTGSRQQWDKWLREKGTESVPSASLMGKGPMFSLLEYDVPVPAHGSQTLLLSLSRGTNEQWAKEELKTGKAEAMRSLVEKLEEDNIFWSQCPVLAGDWPEHWKHGWVYDFETIRMNVRPPIGIFKHPWDAMQVTSPRVVLGETCMDMMTLSYADPELAKKVIFGTFADALVPNIPCAREDGSVNMVSADGSECGTAPMWGYPFHVIRSIYAATHDTLWVKSLYPYLKAYIEWWLEHRTDKEGWLHCNNSWESGQDGSRRFIVAEHNEGAVADFVRTVDVEASMAEAMLVMRDFSLIAGIPADREYWQSLAERRVKNTRAMFFDNWFRDIDGRINKPILLKDYYDVMMLAPLTCGIATEAQTKAVKPMFSFFQKGKQGALQWPPGVFTFCEAAWNAGTRDIASEILASTADRVYRRTDARSVLYYDSTFSYRVPGVANEFWPFAEVPAGGENYGWGATLPMNILRTIIGFRESTDLGADEFTIAPMIPKDMCKPGLKYTVKNLHYHGIAFDLTYEMKNSILIGVTIDYRSNKDAAVSVTHTSGKKVYQQKEKSARGKFSFDTSNGNVLTVRFE
jgi:hypothetical protein